MQKYDFLDRLQADRDFADYLIANGWGVVLANLDLNCPELGEYENISFTKQDKKGFTHMIIWVSSYRKGTSFTTLYKGSQVSYLQGTKDIEGNVFGFSCLCHAMGWVPLNEANKECKAATGGDLFQAMAIATKPLSVAEIFNPIVKAHTGYEQAY